jgi:hypothetical protein
MREVTNTFATVLATYAPRSSVRTPWPSRNSSQASRQTRAAAPAVAGASGQLTPQHPGKARRPGGVTPAQRLNDSRRNAQRVGKRSSRYDPETTKTLHQALLGAQLGTDGAKMQENRQRYLGQRFLGAL